jgi:uncharacterized membrane protein
MDLKNIVSSALVAAISVGAASAVNAGPADKPKFSAEKCYGIAKAGKNDCQTAASACAGTSTSDGQADAWMFVPKGTCDRIVGGNTKSKG